MSFRDSPAFFIFGGMMFDLKNCVNCDGVLYCWHPLTNSIVKIELKSVAIKDCQDSVIEVFLKTAYGESQKGK